ncbi:MAG: hypothetical protein LBO03_03505 [Acidaminococcales bacterium]|jgi:hypothetical protein|nr:hypothetical protein [Acidaminococcales bacterium]
MRFISLTVKKGLFQDTFDFNAHVNIVHSEKNSVGKTTLLRFLMFSLGYPIPGTRGLNFARYEFEADVISANHKTYRIVRFGDIVTLIGEGDDLSFSLPSDLNALHKIIFGIQNDEVLENLLGAYYVDQEKGWTLLNRGKAIGSIHFSIEGLIRGLSGRSNDELAVRLSSVKRELQKYKHMLDVARYQAEINALGENIAYDAPIDEIDTAIDVLLSERKPIFDELERVKNVIRKNMSFKKYIDSFQLRVRSLTTDEEIPVNEDTIIGFRDDANYLATKRKMVEMRLAEIDNKIANLRRQQDKENTLFDVQTSIQAFDADVAKMNVDAVSTERIIRRLETERKSLEDAITRSVKSNNPIIGELHTLISAYANELGIDERYVRPSEDYIFTSDLKSLTGAIFHKIVFAFKMSYIKIIGRYTGVNLPLILDSPSGREVDKINIADMIAILVRDFSEHQIIIASINLYDFVSPNILEIKNQLLSF